MNPYETKQAERRERMKARAERKRGEAADLFERDQAEMSLLPLGQPILVGHHSEGPHRRMLERSRRRIRRVISLENEAMELDRRAAAPPAGVSSDDPDGADKLRKQLAKREAAQEHMKRANRLLRTGKLAELAELVGDQAAAAMQRPDFAGRTGFADYELKNNNAQIRRLRARIAEIEGRSEKSGADMLRQGEAWKLTADHDDNRLRFDFDAKPADRVRQELKARGFRWSPDRGAWIAKMTGFAEAKALYIAGRLAEREANAEPVC